jgi:hypothetical protein
MDPGRSGISGQDPARHRFHEHGNEVRILGRDWELALGTNLAEPRLFTTATPPGIAFDGIFLWDRKGSLAEPRGSPLNS